MSLHRRAALLAIGALLALMSVGNTVLAEEPPEQESDEVSSGKSDSKISQLLLDAVGDPITDDPSDGGELVAAEARSIAGPATDELASGITKAEILSSATVVDQVQFDESGNVEVYIHLASSDEAALQQVRDAVVRVEIENADHGIVQAWVTPQDLGTVASLGAVRRITPPDYAYTKKGSRLTEGDTAHRANLARTFGGLTGDGVKVGVISDGVDAWHTARARGDLPARLEINPKNPGEGHEGTALLEIVHDLAPDASLAFSSGGSSLWMVQAILWLANDAFEGEGADVIVDDLGFYREPSFEDGIVAQAAADAVAGGAVFVSAAGNMAQSHYEADFVDSGDGFHAFDGSSDIAMRLRTAGYVIAILQWNDKFGSSGNDYDLYVCPAGLRPSEFNLLNDICDGSTALQDGDDDPLEIAALYGVTDVDVFIKRDSGVARRLEMFTFRARPREYGVREGGIVHHPAVPGVLAVGAFDEDDPGQDDIESLSDRGPSRIYFPTVQTRLKPDVVAADGVSVTGSGGFPRHFFGTSAAAPHVAGIAALIIEAQRLADPSMTKKNVADAVTRIIRSSATDLGPVGHDTSFGYGRANALAAVESLGSLTATTFTVDSTGDGADSDSRDGVCDDGNGNCTLRAAIAEANRVETSIIDFDIAGSGTQTIQPASALPTITKTVLIDGFSQPGAGSGTFRIQLDGTNAGAAADGLRVSGKQATIRGLVINRFGGNGIELVGSGSGQVVDENRIGVSVSGTSDLGNGDAGVHVTGAPGAIIQDNLISGNDSHGVSISGSAARGVVLDGNLVGTNAAGTGDLGNSGSGVHVSGAGDASLSNNVIAGNDSHGVALTGSGTLFTRVAENHIGATAAGSSLPNGGSGVHIGGGAGANVVEENVIAHNTADGVTVVSGSATGNTVWENSVHSNGGLGIDLNDDGVTANDPNDADNGPNDLQNHPVLTAAGLSSDAGSIAFNLQVAASVYIVDFYASDSCDGSGSGEGKDWLGFAVVVPATHGARQFVVDSFEGTLNDYQYSSGSHITATATVNASTSEFSPCIRSSSLPRLTLSEDSIEVEEGGTTLTTYTVRPSSRPSDDATVDLSVKGDEVVTVSPETLTFTTGNWANPQTVTVTAVDDADPEDEATTLLHRLAIDGKKYSVGLLPVEVSDGDAPIVSFDDGGTIVQVRSVSLNEGASFTYPVVLAEEPAGETRITLVPSRSSVLTVSPQTLTFDTDDYETAQDVTITARADTDATDEMVTIYHETRIGGHDYVLGLIRATIVDSGLPDFTISEAEVSVNEGETATYTVVPDSEPPTSLTVRAESSDTDSVTVSPRELTFTAGTGGNWATPQTVTVTGVADDDGFNDIATIEHAIRHRGTDHDVGEVDVTVVDNNRAPFFEEGLKTTRAVPENSTEGASVGDPVAATDLDGDTLTFGVSAETGGSFDIDASGQIVLAGTSNDFDFETPTDQSVEVTATDPGGLSDSIEVEIIVTDVNEPPEVRGRDALEFDENRTGSITRYSATDPEQDSFGWSVEGTDGRFFSIDATGYLKLEDPLDYEARSDADRDNIYEFVVIATDTAGKAGGLEVSVTIKDVDEAPELFGRTELTVAENDEFFTESYRATDPEGAVISRWGVSGRDGGDFTISETGELSFRNVPDFERPADSGRDNVYEFSVRASDGRNYGHLEVTVTVTNVNEMPTITTTGRTSFSYRENTTATIYTFSATDPERGTITWSPAGADGDDFTITPDSRGRGVLTFTNPPDFENPTDSDSNNEYRVTVQARDDAFNTDFLDITVTVTDLNEGPEVSGPQSLTFSENLQEGRVLATYAATDPEGAVISRWGVSGRDGGDFTISETGELSFRNVPDFERPADSGRDNVYEFSVRASDGRNYGYLEVTVTVTNVNEMPTITTTGRTSFSYRENTTVTIYTFSATDPERGTITWSPTGDDGDDFTITPDSRGRGVLTFTNPPDFERPTDSDRNNEYRVTVQARDDAFNTDFLDVTVTVTDLNEGPEVSGPQSLTFSENLQEGRVLATYAATDPEGAVISRWGVSGRDGGDFTISETGELSFRNVPDFERPADSGRDNVYEFSVRASDGRNYGYLEVTVTVENINEDLTITTTSRTSFTYRENTTATIYTFSATDPERAEISWSTTGADGDDFTITPDSRGRGVLTFTNPPDFENPTDSDRNNEYRVTVQARDDAFNTDFLDVTVTVTDLNEGPEVRGAQSLTFSENQDTQRILATYTATDPENPGAVISRWGVSGRDGGDFTISETGELSFRNVPDFERPADSGRDNVYEFSVRASDGRNYGYLEVTVTVTNVNEMPTITSRTSFTYRENTTATIYTFSATDPERGTITWSPAGADGDDFTITPDSRGRGVLTFTNPPDFENPTDSDRNNEYRVTIQARDDAFNTDFLDVTVTVTDLNEGPEVRGAQSLTFSENQDTQRILATYTATDPENPGAVISRWGVSGRDGGDFTISETGELSFRNVPDFERPADSGRDNVYEFSVRASDGRNYGYLEVTVTVEDINEAPTITTTRRTSFTSRESNTATIYTFSATDPERGTITWLLAGPDRDDFAIHGGMLTFKTLRDFERPTDSDRNNEYRVTVQARDDAFNTDFLDVTVTVTDLNEGPEVRGAQSLTFSENLQEGRVLATYTAADPENPGAVISRWGVSGRDGGDFTMSETGELSFRRIPDFERPADSNRDNVYEFSVRASDGRNYGYLEVTVTVEDINEDLTITTTRRTSFTSRENNTATIYTFSATDPERGTITWSPAGDDGDDFTITPDSRGRGVLTFTNPPDFENPTDSDRNNEYRVTIQARDDAFNTDSLDITITVTDLNEGPEISGAQSLTLSENQDTQRILATYTAADPEDAGAVISRWGVSGRDGGDFTMSETGELSFRNVPDFERPADSGRDNVYEFSVRASDGRNYGYLEVTVTVEDINEDLTITTTRRTSFTSRENNTATIYTFSATDPERGTITWSPAGDDGDDFTITPDSRGRGVLTFTNPPDFENPTDSDRNNEYQVTIQARDDAFNTDSLDITITVTDLNEGPEIRGAQSLTFSENQDTQRILATYTAADPENPGAVISRWGVSGRDGGDFTMSETGELSFRRIPDFERPADSNRDNVYEFSVRASDGRNYGYLEVTVTVEDINEDLTITTTRRTSFTSRENNTATIYTFSATDPERAEISWSTTGPDGDDFTITPDSRGRGVLTFTNPPDFENPTDADSNNEYQVTIQARDDAFNTDSLDITITVTELSEGPEISGPTSFTISENQSLVGATYTASDPEDPTAVITRWNLTGSDRGDFTISETGELSFRNVPDFERPADSNRDNEYRVTVRASDGRYYGTLEVTITVEDFNERPAFNPSSPTSFVYPENGTARIYTFRATDPERADIAWSTSGPDRNEFAIGNSGELSFAGPPNFESPTDADGNNEYQVTVEATDDDFNTASLDITITVTNLTDLRGEDAEPPDREATEIRETDPDVRQADVNNPATGAPTISGTVQVGHVLAVDTTGVFDPDGFDSTGFTYQWTADDGAGDVDITGATDEEYLLLAGDDGKAIRVRVSFLDSENNAESVTSSATAAVVTSPLTASVGNEPQSHDGVNAFTFELVFSEQFGVSFRTLTDDAFLVVEGEVVSAQRLDRDSITPDVRWEITVTPHGSDDVIIILPETTDCSAVGAICTAGGRMLSDELELTVSGPGE